jgi:hypothetical protein
MKKLLLAIMLALSMGVVAQDDDDMDEESPPEEQNPASERPPGGKDVAPTAGSGPAPKIGATPQALTVSVNLTGSPVTGVCGYTMNLSWTAQNASVCTKTGAWSGSGAASGSEQVTVNSASQTYTLTCSSNTDTRTLTWINPTQNVDGTSVALSGNEVWHAASAANIESANPPIVLTPARTQYLLAGLPAGPRVVGIKAIGPTPNSLRSVMSALASVTIQLPTGVDTQQATCTPPPEPKPPTGVTIAGTVWDVRNDPRGGQRIGRDVGTIGLDVACLGTEAYLTQDNGAIEYWKVPRTDPPTKFYRKPRSTIVVGRCQLKEAV